MKHIEIQTITYNSFTISDAEYYVVKQLCNNNMFLKSIKFIRMQYDFSLLDAKKICEKIRMSTESEVN
jgi:hypothetical protein